MSCVIIIVVSETIVHCSIIMCTSWLLPSLECIPYVVVVLKVTVPWYHVNIVLEVVKKVEVRTINFSVVECA